MTINPIPLDDFPRTGRPWNNITPFTYRDGLTYLEVLEALRAWVRDVLTAHLNEEMGEFTEELQQALNDFQVAVIESFNQKMEEFDVDVQAFKDAVNEQFATLRQSLEADIASQLTTVNDALAAWDETYATFTANIQALVDQWTSVQIENNDEITANILELSSSLTKTALEPVLAEYVAESGTVQDAVDNRARTSVEQAVVENTTLREAVDNRANLATDAAIADLTSGTPGGTGDVAAADLVQGPTQTRAAVDSRVSATAEGIIGDIITNDPTVTQTVIDTIEANPTLLEQLAHYKRVLLASDHLDDLATGIYWVASEDAATGLGLPGTPFSGPLTVVRPDDFQGSMVWSPITSPPEVWRMRRNSGGWSDWYPDAPRAVELTASDTDWDGLPDGDYFSHVAGVRTALGLPAQVGWVQKRTGGGDYGIATMQEWAPPYKRWVSRHATTGWQPWEPDTSELTVTDRLKLEDTPSASQIVFEIDHYGDGSGTSSGSTYGIDVQNFPGARQALVIHQYSDNREAVRIDNTDGEAAVYVNNTQNFNINPDNTAAGAPFLKFHPYNMGNFVDFAYLMDDLTWQNDTDKTWSFQSQTGNVVEFKNAAGAAVGHVSQDGVQLRDTGRRNIRSILTPTPTLGTVTIRRVGSMCILSIFGLTFAEGGLGSLATLPTGFRPGETVVTTARGLDTVLQVTEVGNVQAYKWTAGGRIDGSLSWFTDDPFPTTA